MLKRTVHAWLELEKVCCGKKKCGRCRGKVKAHGPYWYLFTDLGKKYLGKTLPLDLEAVANRYGMTLAGRTIRIPRAAKRIATVANLPSDRGLWQDGSIPSDTPAPRPAVGPKRSPSYVVGKWRGKATVRRRAQAMTRGDAMKSLKLRRVPTTAELVKRANKLGASGGLRVSACAAAVRLAKKERKPR